MNVKVVINIQYIRLPISFYIIVLIIVMNIIYVIAVWIAMCLIKENQNNSDYIVMHLYLLFII